QTPEMLAVWPWLETVLAAGYVVAIVDVRGSGASFGAWPGPFSPQEARDAYDITEWLCPQTWCSGAVGMFGRSYMGTNQYLAAAEAPPHLKAIFPQMAMFDLYAFLYGGGIFRQDFARQWMRDVAGRDSAARVTPVDSDTDGRDLAAARAEHCGNLAGYELFARLP